MSPARLREVRRGEAADELELILDDGAVVILHGHGLYHDERARTREAALRLLTDLVRQSEDDPRP